MTPPTTVYEYRWIAFSSLLKQPPEHGWRVVPLIHYDEKSFDPQVILLEREVPVPMRAKLGGTFT